MGFLVYGDNFHVRKLYLDVRFWLVFYIVILCVWQLTYLNPMGIGARRENNN